MEDGTMTTRFEPMVILEGRSRLAASQRETRDRAAAALEAAGFAVVPASDRAREYANKGNAYRMLDRVLHVIEPLGYGRADVGCNGDGFVVYVDEIGWVG
jgi:hypothetical protein